MGNIESVNNTSIIAKTMKDNNDNDNSTTLIIPRQFAKELQIENSKVSMSLIKDLDGNKHLIVSKAYIEIVIN